MATAVWNARADSRSGGGAFLPPGLLLDDGLIVKARGSGHWRARRMDGWATSLTQPPLSERLWCHPHLHISREREPVKAYTRWTLTPRSGIVDLERMEQPPLEFTKPTISEVRPGQATRGKGSLSFKIGTAGESFSVTLWNPRLVRPDGLKPLSAEQLEECFADCGICSVFNQNTNDARMEFQKVDVHLIVKATRIQLEHLANRP